MVIARGRLEQLDGMLKGRQLVIVSNREPYAHRTGPGGISVERPAGGLVAALDPVMQAVSGTWIAWGDGDADFAVADADGRVQVPDDNPRYTLKRIALSRPDVDGYYYGYANQVLWPLCHMVMDQVRVRTRYWETYQAVNRRFAEAVAAEAPRDAVVWLHDYHLATCPRALRELRPDLFLMHFWHVPWPAWDAFRVCPERVALLDGLLANDLLTFQHDRHVEHFLECARRDLGRTCPATPSGTRGGGRWWRRFRSAWTPRPSTRLRGRRRPSGGWMGSAACSVSRGGGSCSAWIGSTTRRASSSGSAASINCCPGGRNTAAASCSFKSSPRAGDRSRCTAISGLGSRSGSSGSTRPTARRIGFRLSRCPIRCHRPAWPRSTGSRTCASSVPFRTA